MIKLLLVIGFSCMCFLTVWAEGDEQIPEGMEAIQVGRAKVIVPKDSRVKKEGGLIILEDTQKYVARKMADIEQRLEKIEENQKQLTEAFKNLEKTLGRTESKRLNANTKDKE